MNRTKLGPVMLLAVFAALALAACGSSNSNGSSADQAQIKQAITAAATSGDPAACTKYQTLKFTEQTSGGKGQAAIHSCEKDAKNTAAKSIDVTDISVDGDNATAKGKATGSIFDGQTLEVALVKENGQWKLDDFQGFENFDKNAMINAVTSLGTQQGESAQANDCVKQQFEQASDQEIENAFIGNDPQAQNQLFGPCQKFSKGG